MYYCFGISKISYWMPCTFALEILKSTCSWAYFPAQYAARRGDDCGQRSHCVVQLIESPFPLKKRNPNTEQASRNQATGGERRTVSYDWISKWLNVECLCSLKILVAIFVVMLVQIKKQERHCVFCKFVKSVLYGGESYILIFNSFKYFVISLRFLHI